MDRTKWPAVTGLICGSFLLTHSLPVTFAVDKPIHTSIAVLFTLAAVSHSLSRLLPHDEGRSHKGQQYDAVPLNYIHTNGDTRDHSPHWSTEDVAYPSSLRKLRIVFLVLVAAICLRIEISRKILSDVQCAQGTWEPVVPLVFAVLDYVRLQRKRTTESQEDENGTLFDVWEQKVFHLPYRYIIAAGLTSLSCLIAIRTTSSPASTHICAASLPNTWLIPVLQYFGTALDIAILLCLDQLLQQNEGRGQRSVALRFSTTGWAFLACAVALSTIAAAIYFASDSEDRGKILYTSGTYFWSAVPLNIVLCSTILSALLCIYHIGTMSTTLIIIFTSTMTTTTAYAWSHPHPYPIRHAGSGFMAITLAIAGFAAFFHIESGSEAHRQGAQRSLFKRVPPWFYLLMLTLFGIRTAFWVQHDSQVGYHPIDLLIWEAKTHHEAYVNQTSVSKTLSEAVRNYQNRYGRHPPPGFDHWYIYATERDSVVVDDFDSIHRDLLPFYALPPETIRQRTWEMVANPWNDVAGLSIRGGKVAISPNVMPTHRWMLDGLVEMIGHFAEWLPDMDLAFNVNDECRVAVPYKEIESMRQSGHDFSGLDKPAENTFSSGRADQWTPIPEEPYNETPLVHISFQRTFERFGSVGCPLNSPARSKRHWDISSACTTCTSPHSLGAFLANWTKASDICHQPDLADLHGIFLSPAAFKGAQQLYPIFSQSKVQGFNDILYPSAWNYMDKAVYRPSDEFPDPDFKEKNTTLFWRGATSEGVSPGSGQWRGMTRQRLVHLSSSYNNSNPSQPLLLPLPSSNNTSPRLRYTNYPISTLSSVLSTDIQLVDTILRCGGKDCPDQAAEFAPLASPTDFQSHWKYKYLLDLDGAGFSGRFLPFLSSRSLPFKAGLFREWWDDRLTPWAHFVPLDIRGHGMWATLAYFAGLDGTIDGKTVRVEGREVEGERIATAGRDWAGKALRKDDMEIYFFRLLLEWGRLTDERREGIGFTLA